MYPESREVSQSRGSPETVSTSDNEVQSPRLETKGGLSKVYSADPTGQEVSSEKSKYTGNRRTIRSWCWNLREICKVICRVLGLNVFVTFFRYLGRQRRRLGRRHEESIKVAIRRSRGVALLRTLIHIVPVGIAIWEVVLNWNTYYVGSFALNQVYYQLGAKVHEIMMQASLAAMVFSYIRYELALGDGLPFGALFSGLQINQVSYLWSMEFWGSVNSGILPLRRKLALLAVVTFSFVLATAVGPSSAILLIPRLDFWPAGSTHVWINATFDELWPTVLDGSFVPESCAISESYISNGCPSSEWQSLIAFEIVSENTIPRMEVEAYGFSLAPTSMQLTGQSSIRQYAQDTVFGENAGENPYMAKSTTQQSAVADALTNTAALWTLGLTNVSTNPSHGSPLSDQQNAVHTIKDNYLQPYALASCTGPMYLNATNRSSVIFPVTPGQINLSKGNYTIVDGSFEWNGIEYYGISESEILEIPGHFSEYRLKWLNLPLDLFAGSTLGSIILLPRDTETSAQSFQACNLAAGWGTSSMNTTTSAGGVQPVISYAYEPNLNTNWSTQLPLPISNYQEQASQGGWGVFREPYFPQIPVNITPKWADYTNPSVPYLNTTVFNALLSVTHGGPVFSAQQTLTSLVANGLARVGFYDTLQGTLRTDINGGIDGNYWLSGKGDVFTIDPTESKDWVKFLVESNLQGYAYNTSGASPKVAIVFLLTYCVFALGHVLYAGISGISSTSWDSIAEVTALAMNSAPTTALRNTCAGINEMHIFKLPVRILTRRDAEGDGEHLELVFGNVDKDEVEERTIKANRKYGTMGSMEKYINQKAE